MKTINYQGREISVRLVNYLSGGLPITPYRDHEGDEDLYKDEAGQYYLRRELNLLDCHVESERDRPASGRIHVHRISTKAAVLWACVRLNARSWDLLEDARDAMSGTTQPALNTYGVSQETLEKAALYAAKYGRTVDEMLKDMLECAAGNSAPVVEAATPEQAENAEDDHQGEDAPVRLAFEYKATERRCGIRVEIEVTREQKAEAMRIAPAFNLTWTKFLRQLIGHDLPKQPRGQTEGDKLAAQLCTEHIAFACFEPGQAMRIERVAESRGQTVEELIVEAVAGQVDCYEEAFVVHPVTGELLCADYDELFTEVRTELLVPPIGREHEAGFQLPLGKQHVQFSVFLTPEQMERLEYPHMVHDCESGEDVPCVLIPINPQGNPRLTVDRKDVTPGEPLVTNHVGILDPETSALVDRYLEVTSEYTARDIINGCLSNSLGMAFQAFDDALNRAKLARTTKAGEFTDDAWGYVEEEVHNARQRRLGEPEYGEEDEAEINGAVEHMRRMLGDGTTLNAVDARQGTEAA